MLQEQNNTPQPESSIYKHASACSTVLHDTSCTQRISGGVFVENSWFWNPFTSFPGQDIGLCWRVAIQCAERVDSYLYIH